MIFNFKYKKDLITLDLINKQLRYYTEVKKRMGLRYLTLKKEDVDGYKFLFKNDLVTFYKSLVEDLKDFLNIEIDLKYLELIR